MTVVQKSNVAADTTSPAMGASAANTPRSTASTGKKKSQSTTEKAKSVAESAKDKAARLADDAREDATQTASKAAAAAKARAADAADSLVGQAESVADDAISRGRAQALQYADAGKSTADHYISSFSRAIGAASDSLHEDGMDRTATYVRAAADGLGRASDEVDGFDTNGVANRLEGFVRSQPLLTVGALALVGFALAGAVKPKNRA